MNSLIDLETKDPAALGMSPEKLAELDNALNYQLGFINSVIIARKGNIVFEKYFQNFGPDDAHDITSVAQGVISALVGIAVDAGHIESIDKKVIDYFPEAAADASDLLKRTLTIRNLLTMTAPYGWKGKEPLDRLRRQKDWLTFILKVIGQKGKPGDFQFSLSNTHLLSAIITKTTGVSTREFANEHLFKPLGMREIPDQEMTSFSKDNVFGKSITGWIKDPQGYHTGGWGLTLTPRDLIRFGQLYLNNGKWGDKQVISESWVKDSIAQQCDDYGYLWWLREDDGIFTYLSAGIGGTYLYCIPEKDLVIGVVSKFDKMFIDRWELVEGYIIPAVLD